MIVQNLTKGLKLYFLKSYEKSYFSISISVLTGYLTVISDFLFLFFVTNCCNSAHRLLCHSLARSVILFINRET